MTDESLNQADDNEFDTAFDEATGAEPEVNDELPEAEPEPQAAAEKSTDELLEELRRERDDWRHQFQSNNGRISTYQKQIQDLQAQIGGQRKPAGQQQQPQSMDDDDWKRLKEDFPEIATAMDKRLKLQLKAELDAALSNRIGEFDKRLKPIETQAHQQRIRNEYAALQAAHPDYVDVVRSNDFKTWMQAQPQPMKQLYQSQAASDAAYLLSTYKAITGKNTPRPTEGIQQHRQARLAQSAAIPAKRVARQPLADDDFDAAWDAITANR